MLTSEVVGRDAMHLVDSSVLIEVRTAEGTERGSRPATCSRRFERTCRPK